MGWIGCPAGANACMVDVKDGRILRIRPARLYDKYTREEVGPWVMRARGKSFEPSDKSLVPPLSLAYKKRVFSPARIRYPMRRVDFDPAGAPGSTGPGGRNIQNRGVSKYQRISWDEALDIVTSELLRVREQYGPTAVLYQNDGHGETKVVHGPHGCGRKLLDLLGGFTCQMREPDSWEGWVWGAKHVWGCEPVGQQQPQANLLSDISKNAELLLFWGCDQETTPWGWGGQLPSRLTYWWTELGIKQIYIAPDCNYANAVHADKWIPVLPNTDAALYLAIAHHWFENGTYDKEYLETHAYGVDRFEAYVMGEEDGIAKTPEWASPITGVPARIIKALAADWASKRTTMVIGNGGPGIRGPYATEPARLQALCLAMQGLGKPGRNQSKMIEWGMMGDPKYYPQPVPSVMVKDLLEAFTGATPVVTNHPSFIPKSLITRAILDGEVDWYGNEHELADRTDQFVHYKYPAEGCSKIHMIWTDSPSWITCWNCGNDYVKAARHPDIEFIFCQHPWIENDALFADVLLPVNTKLEEDDINTDTQLYMLFPEQRCIEPLGESFSDYEIVCKIAERLGLLEEYTGGKTVEDLIKIGYETSGVAHLVTWDELREKGYFVVPSDPDWEKTPAGLLEFYEDPEKHPLSTPTGKLEFYSTGLADHFPDDEERPPVPRWIPQGESHEETLGTGRSKKYPLLVMSNHPRWGVHSQHDDITWLREIETCKVRGADGYQYQPLWMNAADAAARGIRHGDVVSIYNERGTVLAGAYVTERIIPGAVGIDHGAKYDPIVPGEIDRGGAINTIVPRNTTSKNACGEAVSGFLVEVEKADLDDLRARYPEAFARPYHASAGPCIAGFMAGGRGGVTGER
ncbi:MAG: molybdopterin-dependent oxidoreductase [Thermoleophilia bacterium]|nr:molybdopterin-dependent oxidoreductase [Thermoleophilia bacterium]